MSKETKEFVVLMEQAELFKVFVEASDRSQAIELAHEKFSQGDCQEAGETSIVAVKVVEADKWEKQNK